MSIYFGVENVARRTRSPYYAFNLC